MLIGQTIVAEHENDTEVYTPWFPRQGNNCTSTVEVIAIADDGSLKVELFNKDSDAPDPGAANGSKTVAIKDVQSFRSTDIKQLVRYKITLSTTTAGATVYCHFRMLNPSWEATGAQDI